jgi:hypothetical protein
MKTKISFLIAVGLFFAFSSKAQYGVPCPDNRVVIQGRLFIPVPPLVTVQFSNSAPVRYDDYRDRRYDNNVRYDDRCDRKEAGYNRYDDRGDWRAAEYERYCREQRGYRMSREEFYRDRCDSKVNPHYKQKKVVVYGY